MPDLNRIAGTMHQMPHQDSGYRSSSATKNQELGWGKKKESDHFLKTMDLLAMLEIPEILSDQKRPFL